MNEFLKACRREKTAHTPVWLMRQAGRYQADYRAIRACREFLDLCKDSDLAAEITVSAQKKLGADAAILFSDILVLIEPLGFQLEYRKGDGPSIGNPVRAARDVDRVPASIDPDASLGFVMDAARKARAALAPGVALIGFAAAPFTLASYLIEGGPSKDFERTKRIMLFDDAMWRTLLEKIAAATTAYLRAQIRAGVQAVQLFDSWAGCLEPREYEAYALPYTRAVLDNIKEVPTIHFGTGTASFLEMFARAGDVIGVDHRVRLDEAWRRIGEGKAIQGNLDPLVLCSSPENIRSHVKSILEQAAGRPGHIFNLGHGVLPETPEVYAKLVVDLVHELSRN